MEKNSNTFSKIKQELTWPTFTMYLRNINFLSSYDSSSSFLNKKDRIEYPQINFDKFTNPIENDIEENMTHRQYTEMTIESRKIYASEIDYPLLYELYREINKDKKNLYIFEEFHNIFKILNYILINFKDSLKINLEEIIEEKIIFYFTNFNTADSILSEKGETSASIILQNINSKITKENRKIQNLSTGEIFLIKNLLFLFYVFTMCGQLVVHTPICLKDYFHNVNLYSRMFVSHFKYFLLIHIMMIIFYQLAYREEMNLINSENIFKNDSKENSGGKINQGEIIISIDKIRSPTLFFIDLDGADKNFLSDEFDKLILISNLSKFFLFNYFTVDLNLNLNFLNFEFFRETIFFYEFIPELSGISDLSINPKSNFFSNLFDMSFLKNNNFFIEKIFVNLNIEKNYRSESKDEIIQTNGQGDKNPVSKFSMLLFFQKFEEIFKKSSCIFITDNIPPKSTFVPLNAFLNQFEVVYALINFLSKIFQAKKKKKQKFSFLINLNFFTIYLPEGISKENLNPYQNRNSNSIFSFIKSKTRKNLQFTTNFSNVQEKEFLAFLSETSNFLRLHRKFFELIKHFKDKFKKILNINFTLQEENFEIEELNTLVHLLSLSLHNYIEEKKLKHIQIKEISNIISPKHTLYLTEIYKEKDKKNILEKFLNKMHNATVTYLLKFSDYLINNFVDIVISDMLDNTYPFRANILYRNFRNNKAIFICRKDNCFLIDLYVHDVDSLERIIQFIKTLKSDKTIGVLIKRIRMVCYDSMFRQAVSNVKSEQAYKAMFSLVDNMYVISSTKDCRVEYDIYVLENKLCILLTSPCVMRKSRRLEEEVELTSMKKMIYIIFKIIYEDELGSNEGSSCIDNTSDIYKLTPAKKDMSSSETNLLRTLLNSKERYFTHIQFIYRLYPNSSFRMLDLYDNYLAIRKICTNSSSSINSITNLFNNIKLLKSKQTLPIFIIYFESNVDNKRNLLRNIIDLKLVDDAYNTIKLDDVFNPSTSTEELSSLLNSFLKVFLYNLHNKIFYTFYNQLRLISFSQKTFFLFMNLFSDFYRLSQGSLFKNIILLPLYDHPNDTSNRNYNTINKNLFEIFLEEFQKFYFKNTFYYLIAGNIDVINTDCRSLSKEFIQEMKNRGLPLRRSCIEATMKQVITGYERVRVQNVFKYQSMQMFSILYTTYSKNKLHKKLNLLREEKIFQKLICFLKIEVSINCYQAKKDLFENVVEDVQERKKEIKNNEKLIRYDSEKVKMDRSKFLSEDLSHKIKDERTDIERNKKNKKCLIY